MAFTKKTGDKPSVNCTREDIIPTNLTTHHKGQ